MNPWFVRKMQRSGASQSARCDGSVDLKMSQKFKSLFKRNILFGVMALGVSSESSGFTLNPDRHFFSGNRPALLSQAASIDSEYESDLRAYEPTLASDLNFGDQAMAYQASLGSLSSESFLFYQRLFLRKPIRETLNFGFFHLTQENREERRRFNIVELERSIHEAITLSVYGQAAGDKQDVDVGFSATLAQSDQRQLRLFWSFADFVRNQRSLDQSRFRGSGSAQSFGFVGSQVWGNRLSRWGFRRDLPTRLAFETTRYEFVDQQTLVWVEQLTSVSERWQVEIRAQYDKAAQSLRPEAGSLEISDAQERERLFVQLVSAHKLDGTRLQTFRPGVRLANREWRRFGQEVIRDQNILVFSSLEMATKRRPWGQDRLELSTDANFFSRKTQTTANEIELRLGLRYQIAMGENTSLKLYLSSDLDEIRFKNPVGSFEGGHGELTVYF